MVEELDKLRSLVQSYGWIDEGSEQQAAEIMATLPIAMHELEQAIYSKYPAVKQAVEEGII